MNSVLLALFGLVCFGLAYRFYSKLLAERVFGLDDSRTTPAHAKRDGVDFVPTDRHVLFGHHFTSIAGAAPILGPAIAVIWGWVPALLWVVFGTVFVGAVHDFGCLFLSTRNGGTTVADLTGRIVGPRARILFLLLVFFLAWIVIAVFAVVIGTLFTNYPETVLPVNFEIVVACVIGYLIYKRGSKLLVPSLLALILLYVMVFVGARYTRDFRLPILFKPAAEQQVGRVTSAPKAATEIPQGARLQVSLNGGPPQDLILPATQGGPATALALQAAVRRLPSAEGVPPAAYTNFQATYDPESGRYRATSGAPGEESAVAFSSPPPARGPPDAAPLLGFAAGAKPAPAQGAFKRGRVKTWVILLLLYSFVASVLPVWLLLQPRDYINSHQLFVGLGAMYLGLLIYHPPVVAPALRLEDTGGGSWFPFLFVTIACGAISGFHGLVGSGTTSKQVDKESDTRSIGYGSMLGEGALALMALLACTAGFASTQEWHSHYATWDSAKGLGVKLGAFVQGGSTFLEQGLGLPASFAKAVIAVIVISFAATTLDTATRIQRFILQELAGSYEYLKPVKNRFVASAIAAFLPLILVFGGGSKPYWLELWPIFGASNQMLGALCLLVLTFYLIRRGRSFWFVGLPCVLLAGMTSFAMLLNLKSFYEKELWLLASLSVILLALSVWILLEGVLTLRRLRTAPESKLADGLE
jgi:carbon starvation protein